MARVSSRMSQQSRSFDEGALPSSLPSTGTYLLIGVSSPTSTASIAAIFPSSNFAQFKAMANEFFSRMINQLEQFYDSLLIFGPS